MLTPQQKKFAQEYINKNDKTKAAKLAGVPDKFAKKVAEDWLNDAEVKAYIDKEIDGTIERTKLTRDWIVNETKKVLQRADKPQDAVACLTLLDKLLTKIDSGGADENAPQIIIQTDGDLNIL